MSRRPLVAALSAVACLGAGVGAPLGGSLRAQGAPGVGTSVATGAGGCTTITSYTGLGALSGRRIATVRFAPEAPAPFPGPAERLSRLHARTRAATVRRHVLFAAGDTVDTLRVAESLRRLRRLRYVTDVRVVGETCGTGAPIAITVATRDEWSTKPVMSMRSQGASLGIEERNLLGTGREAAVAVRTDQGRTGLRASGVDPSFLGDRAALALGVDLYRDGSARWLALGRRERSVLDRWRLDAGVFESRRMPRLAMGEQVHRLRAGVEGARRIRLSGTAATSVIGGLAFDGTGVVAGAGAPLVGPEQVRRAWTGVDLGLRRRSVDFDTLTWLLPAGALVDVPLAFEADAVLGAGHDAAGGTMLGRLDAWAGKMWLPAPGHLLVADAWLSGFRGPRHTEAGRLRASLDWRAAAARGTWDTRLAVERLVNPDPDLHTLTAGDPTLRALPDRAWLAEGGLSASVERDVRLRRLTRSWWLAGAAFGAGSLRWDPADGTLETARAVVLGAGLRLSPTRLGRASARLDVGWPLVREADARRGLVVGISVSPWLEDGRGRAARSTP